MQWLTRTHAQRWHRAHGTVGTGALYQGRYKPVAVKNDHHFLSVCRYVESNPVRAGLVHRACDWRWSSAWSGSGPDRPVLSPWPVPRPVDWAEQLNAAQSTKELLSLRRCTARGLPFGDSEWMQRVASQLGLEGRLRGRGRPSRADENLVRNSSRSNF
jgi:putative transposase